MTGSDAVEAAPWTAFVGEWKALDLSALRSEQDVREEVLAPMLRMLGYGGSTLNTVLREHPEPLPRRYRMVGSARIQVDYVPTLRLRRFWIMEAKKPGGLNPDAFLQAHFYATYPTITARFIVLADGAELRVYDSGATEYEEARVVVRRETAERDFQAVYELLAARNIGDAIRRDTLRDVERVLAVETDAAAPRSFENEIAAVARRVRPVIAENARQLVVAKFRTETENRLAYLRSVDVRTLLAVMAHPTEVGSDTSSELARRLSEGDEEARRTAARAALDAVAGPARQTVRFGVMQAFLEAAASCVGSDPLNLLSSGVALARANLTYAADEPVIGAAIHLENAVDRISMKIVQSVMQERFAEAERLALRTRSPEELLLDPPSRNIPLIMRASGLAAHLWSGLHGQDADEVLRRVRAIERFEREHFPELPPRLVGDQIMFAYKGREFDFLIRATVDGLARILAAAPGLLPEDLAEAGAGWAAHRFPATPAVPDGDEDVHVRLAFEAMVTVLRQVADGNSLPPNDLG